MVTREMWHRLIGTAVFAVLPAILLLKTGTALLGGPASANAMSRPFGQIDSIDPSSSTQQWTEQQRIAAEYIQSLRNQVFGPSPLFRSVVQVDPDQPGPVVLSGLPEVTVQMIMSSSSGNAALIDDQRYSVGDAIGTTEWVIIEIDAESRTVTFEHAPTGRTAAVSVHTPE